MYKTLTSSNNYQVLTTQLKLAEGGSSGNSLHVLTMDYPDPITISIIGASGNNQHLSKQIFERAKDNLKTTIKNLPYSPSQIILTSGGSSGIDHLAILLYLKSLSTEPFAGLILHFPCGWNGKFYSKNQYDLKATNLLTLLHSAFSYEIKRDSIHDIILCVQHPKCYHKSYMGFFQRNDEVAKCDILIAMTFSSGNKPSDGGTAYTWKKSLAPSKIHISL